MTLTAIQALSTEDARRLYDAAQTIVEVLEPLVAAPAPTPEPVPLQPAVIERITSEHRRWGAIFSDRRRSRPSWLGYTAHSGEYVGTALDSDVSQRARTLVRIPPGVEPKLAMIRVDSEGLVTGGVL